MLRLMAAALLFATSLAPLTNEDVVKMSKAGLSAETIIAKIRMSETRFATDTDSLVALKKEGVDDAVIRAMLPPSRGTAAAPRVRRKRFNEVTVATSGGGRCEHATLEVSTKGVKTTGCHETDVNVEWKNATAVCYLYSFRSTLVVSTAAGERRVHTATPAELKAVAEAVRALAPGVPETASCR